MTSSEQWNRRFVPMLEVLTVPTSDKRQKCRSSTKRSNSVIPSEVPSVIFQGGTVVSNSARDDESGFQLAVWPSHLLVAKHTSLLMLALGTTRPHAERNDAPPLGVCRCPCDRRCRSDRFSYSAGTLVRTVATWSSYAATPLNRTRSLHGTDPCRCPPQRAGPPQFEQ